MRKTAKKEMKTISLFRIGLMKMTNQHGKISEKLGTSLIKSGQATIEATGAESLGMRSGQQVVFIRHLGTVLWFITSVGNAQYMIDQLKKSG